MIKNLSSGNSPGPGDGDGYGDGNGLDIGCGHGITSGNGHDDGQHYGDGGGGGNGARRDCFEGHGRVRLFLQVEAALDCALINVIARAEAP